MAKLSKKELERLKKEWEEHCLFLEKNTPDPEKEKIKEETKQRALKDYRFFVERYFIHYIRDKRSGVITPTPQFHIDAAEQLTKDEPRTILACMWARGHGKSTTISLIIPIWKMLRGEIHNVMLVGKSNEDATRLLQHIMGELIYNDLLLEDFSIDNTFITKGNWTKGEFVVNGYDTAFTALGRGQSPRGYRRGAERLDYIVIDDADDDQLTRSEERVKEGWEWMTDALFNATGTEYKIVYVQNLYAKNSLFYKFIHEQRNVNIIRVDAIKEDGTITWPERFTPDYLESIKDRGSISFLREYQNEMIIIGSVFKQEHIKYKKMNINSEDYDFLNIYFDPAWASNSKSDYKAVTIVGKYKQEYHIVDCFGTKLDINTVVAWIYDKYEEYTEKGLNLFVYMESNFMQNLIWEELQTVSDERGYNLPIVFDDRQKGNKTYRIMGMQGLFERGLIFFNEEYKDNSSFEILKDQLLGFTPGSTKTHDDLPDSLESNIWWVNKLTRQTNSKPIIDEFQVMNY